jgi:hypothetical protein
MAIARKTLEDEGRRATPRYLRTLATVASGNVAENPGLSMNNATTTQNVRSTDDKILKQTKSGASCKKEDHIQRGRC